MYNDRKRGASALPMQRKNTSLAMHTYRDEDPPIIKKVLLSSLWGLGACAASGILLVTIVTFIALASPDPLSMIPALSLASLLPANFLGGFVSAKKCGESSFVCGLVTGAMWCVMAFIVSLCLVSAQSSNYELWQAILLHSLSLLFCILGSLSGGIKRKPSHKKRRFG